MSAARTAKGASGAAEAGFPGAMVSPVFEIPVDAIVPSAANPRRSFDEALLAELAESIKSVGVQVPLLLRPKPILTVNEVRNLDGARQVSEIVSGERRWRAAKMAGLATVPAIVRALTDAEARDAALVENLQREDLPAIEEADAYAALIETLGSMQALAARVGKPIEYVTRRLRLRTLGEPARQCLAERLITVDHALLLAKLETAEQETALRHTLQGYRHNRDKTAEVIAEALKERATPGTYWEPESVVALKEYISSAKLALKSAPWDLADASLVESAGACTTCPKNTAANAALFGDLAIAGAACMDAACYAAKKAAFVERQVRAVEAAGEGVVRISWKASAAKPRMIDGKPIAGQVFKAGQWIAAQKGDPCAVQAVAVDDLANPYRKEDFKKCVGAKLLVCVGPGCRLHKKTWEEAALPKKSGSTYDPKAEEAKRKTRAEAAAAENKIRLQLAQQALAKLTKQLPPEILRIVIVRAARFADVTPQVEQAIRLQPVASAAWAKAVASMALQIKGLEIDDYQAADAKRTEFLAALKLFGVDGRAAWQKKPEGKPATKKKDAPVSPAAAKAVHAMHPKKKKAGKQ